MGRFAASKYKNAAAKKLKKEDTAFGIRINELCQNDPVACGVDKVVFAGEAASIGLLDAGELGNVQPRSLRGHSEYVRSLEFSPFNKDCLCTCAGDGMVKLWNTHEMVCSATLNVSEHVHMTRFHPVAEHLLLVAEHDDVTLYDVTSQRQLGKVPGPATSVSWSYDGRLACSAGRTGEVVIRDLRARSTEVTKATLFDQHKDVSHEWIGTDKLLLSGYQNKGRVYRTVDISNLRQDISMIELGAGSGAPHSKFDYDTRMLFLYTKGDHGFTYCEVGAEGTININFKEQCNDVIKGMALAPKSLLDVMSGEVNRLLILHPTSLSPTPYTVPRRSYAEFHTDLFPDTRGEVPGTDAECWWNGNDGYRELVSLDPTSKSSKSNGHKNGTVSVSVKTKFDEITADVPEAKIEENKIHNKVVSNLTEGQSVYRNIEGVLSHKNLHYHGLKNVENVLPQESNGLQTGRRFGVHLMTGSAGRLGVFDLSTPGQNNTLQLEIVNGGNPLVCRWDGLDRGREVLAVGGDCGMVNLWKVDDVTTPATLLHSFSHGSKVTMLSYHPGVPGLLVSGDGNGQLSLWDTTKYTKVREMGDVGECVTLCWDLTNGYLLHLVLKSGTVKTIDWRNNSVMSCELGVEVRNARMCSTKMGPVVSVFGLRNSRLLFALSRDSDDVIRVLGSHDLGNGTSLYVPAVHPDLNLVFCTARGEGSVVPFEVRSSEPYILPLAVYIGQDSQNACSPLPKYACNLMEVEVLKMYKLCKDSVQLVTMRLPRLRKEYFQDDIYGVSQLNSAAPVLPLQDWLDGGTPYNVPTFDPCPEGTKRVSDVEIVRASSQHAKIQQEHLKYKSHEAQRDELFNSFAEQVQKDAGPLAQELMEGCDDDEWSD